MTSPYGASLCPGCLCSVKAAEIYNSDQIGTRRLKLYRRKVWLLLANFLDNFLLGFPFGK
jgi:hypothetical protein